MLSALLTPEWGRRPFLDELLEWERAVESYEAASGERFSGSTKCAVVSQWAPDQVRELLWVNAEDLTQDWQRLRTAIRGYYSRGVIYSGDGMTNDGRRQPAKISALTPVQTSGPVSSGARADVPRPKKPWRQPKRPGQGQGQGQGQRWQPQKQQGQGQGQGQRRCLNCQGARHAARHCPSPRVNRRSAGNQSAAVQCRQCHKWGHYAAQCRRQIAALEGGNLISGVIAVLKKATEYVEPAELDVKKAADYVEPAKESVKMDTKCVEQEEIVEQAESGLGKTGRRSRKNSQTSSLATRVTSEQQTSRRSRKNSHTSSLAIRVTSEQQTSRRSRKKSIEEEDIVLREAFALDVPSLARARRVAFNEEIAEEMLALNEPGNSVLVDLPDWQRRYRGQDHDASWMPGDFSPDEAAPVGARSARPRPRDSMRATATTTATETMTTSNSTAAMTTTTRPLPRDSMRTTATVPLLPKP